MLSNKHRNTVEVYFSCSNAELFPVVLFYFTEKQELVGSSEVLLYLIRSHWQF